MITDHLQRAITIITYSSPPLSLPGSTTLQRVLSSTYVSCLKLSVDITAVDPCKPATSLNTEKWKKTRKGQPDQWTKRPKEDDENDTTRPSHVRVSNPNRHTQTQTNKQTNNLVHLSLRPPNISAHAQKKPATHSGIPHCGFHFPPLSLWRFLSYIYFLFFSFLFFCFGAVDCPKKKTKKQKTKRRNRKKIKKKINK